MASDARLKRLCETTGSAALRTATLVRSCRESDLFAAPILGASHLFQNLGRDASDIQSVHRGGGERRQLRSRLEGDHESPVADPDDLSSFEGLEDTRILTYKADFNAA